jgi:LuxR family transcriptional regulator, maltose regulon positive regulatory protein
MGGPRTDHDPVTVGWDALRSGEWQRARACFEEALAGSESAEVWEGLGWSAYCLDDDRLTLEARERAYRLYREQGDDQSAARVAAWLAADWAEFRGETAVCNGWLQRAHRLLGDSEPGPGHGWLAVHEASMILYDDPATARRLALEATELGRRFGVVELETLGLALEGSVLVSEGDLDVGMRRLDEATATALGGEAELLVCVAWACCYLISACEQVRDYDRAGQWCRQVGDFCERHGIGLLLGICRAKYAGVLTWQGRWEEAESEVTQAAAGLAARPPLVAEAVARLAELRRLQGRYDDAETLLARCEGDPRALLVQAQLALDRGRLTEAAELAERFLRRFAGGHRIERGPGLEVAVRAYAELGQCEHAREALEQLRAIALRAETRPLRAALFTAEASLAAALGDRDAARRWWEDAIDALAGSPASYELGRARLGLAAVLEADGRVPEARSHVEAALDAFRHLGADAQAAGAEAMLGRLDQAQSPGADDGPLDVLSPREREVVALVAVGMSNREIAERLVISEHTVHRHVTSILRKLGLRSRAAAASLAARHGLV